MTPTSVRLPVPRRDGGMALAAALARRRSVRDFAPAPLALAELGQLLWAAQGVTDGDLRTAPSAGALYPLETWVVAAHVTGLAPGLHHYLPATHALEPVATGETTGTAFLAALARASLGQAAVAEAAAAIVIGAIEARTAVKYGPRAGRYVALEAGHAAQNVLLTATALGLGAVPVGAFDDAAVTRLLATRAAPLYVLPVGRPRSP